MLIEFKVSNYRSFNEEVVFSMAAAPRLKKKDNTHTLKLKGDPLPPLLKTAAIYGPNASGKSNFVKALAVLKAVFTSSDAERKKFNVQPFKLNESADEVTKFCISFVSGSMRYEFGLWLTSERVLKEWLIYYPLGEESILYERIFNAQSLKDDYNYGQSLEGGAELHKIWSSLVSSKALFFKQAAANSGEEFTQLKSPLNWFNSVLYVSGIDKMAEEREKSKFLVTFIPELRKDIAKFLSEVDIPMHELVVGKPEKFETAEDLQSITASFTHNINGKLVHFDFDDESEGTKNLFALSTKWLSTKHQSTPMQKALASNVFIFDEFDSSLHPTIVARLIEQQCKNTEGSQFIFTTHDTHLMDAKVLRRDQFWLTERNRQGASTLTSIYEYKGREGEDIEKRYYEGRYRALPILS